MAEFYPAGRLKPTSTLPPGTVMAPGLNYLDGATAPTMHENGDMELHSSRKLICHNYYPLIPTGLTFEYTFTGISQSPPSVSTTLPNGQLYFNNGNPHRSSTATWIAPYDDNGRDVVGILTALATSNKGVIYITNKLDPTKYICFNLSIFIIIFCINWIS